QRHLVEIKPEQHSKVEPPFPAVSDRLVSEGDGTIETIKPIGCTQKPPSRIGVEGKGFQPEFNARIGLELGSARPDGNSTILQHRHISSPCIPNICKHACIELVKV